MNAPKLALACFIAKRLERDRDFYYPAIRRDHSLGFHHDVHAEVRAGAFSHDSVSLHSERIKAEEVCPPLIVEGVKIDPHIVFAKNLVAFGYARPHFVGLIVTMKGDVERPCIVADHHLRRFRRRYVVAGISLQEILEHRRLLPYFVVQFAVDYGRLIKTRNDYRFGFLGWDGGPFRGFSGV